MTDLDRIIPTKCVHVLIFPNQSSMTNDCSLPSKWCFVALPVVLDSYNACTHLVLVQTYVL